MKQKGNLLLGAVILVIVAAIVYFEPERIDFERQELVTQIGDEVDQLSVSQKAAMFPKAVELVQPGAFINSEPFALQDHIGDKVILLDFWTYSCINCQRTLPYLTDWHEKYADDGLLIIGSHTPEFEFEKIIENVEQAVEKWGVSYPVFQDNDFLTWRAYRNRYWPRKYLIDIDGFIVYDHIGEGAYDITERKIQELLKERAMRLNLEQPEDKAIIKPEDAEDVDFFSKRSPEVYLGAWRNDLFESGAKRTEGTFTFEEPKNPERDKLYLVGEWEITHEFARNLSADAKIIFPYQAQKLFMVLAADQPVQAEVLRNGKPLGEATGEHVETVSGQSIVTVESEDLYRLIEDPNGSGKHNFELIIKEPGLKAFTFTFG